MTDRTYFLEERASIAQARPAKYAEAHIHTSYGQRSARPDRDTFGKTSGCSKAPRISIPSTSRGPDRLKYDEPSTTYAQPPAIAGPATACSRSAWREASPRAASSPPPQDMTTRTSGFTCPKSLQFT